MSTSPNTRSEQADELTDVLLRAVQWNTRLNATVRSLLALLGLAATAAAIFYTIEHSDAIVAALSGADADAGSLAQRLIMQSWPVAMLVALAILLAGATWIAHARGQEELADASEGVGRLRRESEVAIPARALTHVFEEKLANARRAYVLQLWLGRALFLVSLGLFSAAVINQLVTENLIWTATYATGSIAGVIFGTATSVPESIGRHLANVIQIQCTITGCDRQIVMFETYAEKALAEATTLTEALDALGIVHTRIEAVIDAAIQRIERYAEPRAGDAKNAHEREDDDDDEPPGQLQAVR